MKKILAEISLGELADKITILEIKMKKIVDNSSETEKLNLINAHPELGKKLQKKEEKNLVYSVKYKKLTYHAVEKSMNKYYFDVNHNLSSALDILASYLKGQKIIYMESKHSCDLVFL